MRIVPIWAVMRAYTPPLAPARYTLGSIMDDAREPAITPQKYTERTLHHLCAISKGTPSSNWTPKFTTKCEYLEK